MNNTQTPALNICVVGSLNMDLVLRAPRCAEAGETLLGHDFALHPGGKGANQAVACARMGSRTGMIGKLGNDAFAVQLRETLTLSGVDHRHVSTEDGSSGIAMIVVEDNGQNRIMLAPGANAALTITDIDTSAEAIRAAALLICQLEVPQPCVRRAFDLAREAGVPILFNPAPAIRLDPDMLSVDYLVVNETEAALIADLPVGSRLEAEAAARTLLQSGARHVLLTLGADGAIVADETGLRHYPAFPTRVVDTTAAGDTFIGGLATGLIEGMTLDQAVRLGMAASALCVSRPGAQPSIPSRDEITLD
jgi:ribokinase